MNDLNLNDLGQPVSQVETGQVDKLFSGIYWDIIIKTFWSILSTQVCTWATVSVPALGFCQFCEFYESCAMDFPDISGLGPKCWPFLRSGSP